MFRFNTAGQNLGFLLVNSSNGAGLTGVAASVVVSRVIDNGPQIAAAGTVTEKGNGQYNFAPTAADLAGSQISFLFAAPGAVPVEKTVVTTKANPQDAQAFGLTALPGNGSLLVKPAVTLAAGDVSGNLPAALADKTGLSLAANQSFNNTGQTAKVPATVAAGDGADSQAVRTTIGLAGAGLTAVPYTGPAFPGDYQQRTQPVLLPSGVATANGQVAIANAIAALPAPDNASVGAIKAKTDLLPNGWPANLASLAITAGSGLVSINLAQVGLVPRPLDAIPDSALTVGDGLVAAIAGAAGKESLSGTSYLVKTPFTGTLIRTFTLDSATAPTGRS